MERLIKIGSIKSKHSSQVKTSRLGIGFEKLDRAVFDPEKAYDKVAELGLKWVRLQSGWARTEKTKGVYEFEWMDSIVDNLTERGLKPWICLAYGNALYTPEAKEVFGAVACPPIHTSEEREAWSRYVSALCSRYRGKAEYFEIWNEPNWCWKYGPDGTEYGEFAVLTAKAIKAGNPDAKIIGGVESVGNLAFINKAFKTGMGDYINFFSFHIYTADERKVTERMELIRGICDMYNPNIKIIQGESGAPSRSDGSGELSWGAWTQRKQAKLLARHALADLLSDVEFTSYFSCMDMIEALHGNINEKESYLDYGYFGVLGADFDENGFSTGDYTPKMSYKSLQVISSVFADEFETAYLPVGFTPKHSDRVFGSDVSKDIVSGGFKRPDGSSAFVYWYSSDLMTTDFESTVTLQLVCEKEMKLVDLLDGTVYKIPDSLIEDNDGSITLKNIPVKDYPLLITFGDFAD